MGAWGVGTFENDDALDWLGDLTDTDDSAAVRARLAQALASDCLDAPDATTALAAAETVLSMLDAPTPSLAWHEEFAAWLPRHAAVADAALGAAAVDAVDRVLGEDSELRELWDETDDAGDWRAAVAALRSALVARLGVAR
ncbi:protein of unknown function [Lysobacter sp. yr284]|uniref:DUF4259 domain-containing protein n=1 Tax=Lysobacter TaxID=68 RepID=UPI000896AD00|nr:DUF4259 domain-containing protein [Lysobacter sp. yr284]SDY70708.1 protein of unknown function [Lysobacter sp. yr284]